MVQLVVQQSGGPTGLHPQHLKNLIDVSAAGEGSSLFGALISFLNLVLQRKTPDAVCPFFFLASLVALIIYFILLLFFVCCCWGVFFLGGGGGSIV